jgi:hypothetical protein
LSEKAWRSDTVKGKKQRGDRAMSTVRVHLSEKVWQGLVLLGQKEQASPDNLLEQAVRRFLQEKGARLEHRRGLQESFGV